MHGPPLSQAQLDFLVRKTPTLYDLCKMGDVAQLESRLTELGLVFDTSLILLRVCLHLLQDVYIHRLYVASCGPAIDLSLSHTQPPLCASAQYTAPEVWQYSYARRCVVRMSHRVCLVDQLV